MDLYQIFEKNVLHQYRVVIYEIYKSNKELIIVVTKLNSPDEPILWSGPKNLWMDGKTGKKCNAPNYGSKLENVASRVKRIFQ